MDFQTTIATAKDVIVAISALAGVGVAYAGLNTWNRQIRGNASYELARRILRNTYALRDTILYVHHDLTSILNSEHVQKLLLDKHTTNSPSTPIHLDKSEGRIAASENLMAELETDFLEAEAIWGTKIGDNFNGLWMMQIMVRFHLRWIVNAINTLGGDTPISPTNSSSTLKELRELAEEYSTPGESAFKEKLNTFIIRAESQVKTHLKHI